MEDGYIALTELTHSPLGVVNSLRVNSPAVFIAQQTCATQRVRIAVPSALSPIKSLEFPWPFCFLKLVDRLDLYRSIACLGRHRRQTHAIMKSFACPFCRYDHHDPSTLVQHINSYHVKPAEQPIEGGPAQASHRTLSTGTHDRRRSYSGSSALDSRPSDSSSYSGKGSSHYRPRHRHQEYAYEHEHGHERPVGDLPLQHSQSSHTAPVRSNSRGPDAPRRRGSSRRLRSVTTTDIAAPSVIFKGFFNACRNSVGHSSKPVLDEKRPIERQVSPRYVQPQERQIINEPLRVSQSKKKKKIQCTVRHLCFC